MFTHLVSMDSSEIECNGYNLASMHRWYDIYGNGTYELHIEYRSEDKKKVKPTDPTDMWQMYLTFCPHDWEFPAIIAHVIADGDNEHTLIGIPGGRICTLYELDVEEDPPYEAARQAIYDADQLIRELYPGYYIVRTGRG